MKKHHLPALRFMASVGEPLNPEAVVWGQQAFGLPFHDNWWQTETGGIMIANFAALDILPGSMGKPVPGLAANIVRRTKTGGLESVDEPMVEGELALKAPWPSMMRGYPFGNTRVGHSLTRGSFVKTGNVCRVQVVSMAWLVQASDSLLC